MTHDPLRSLAPALLALALTLPALADEGRARELAQPRRPAPGKDAQDAKRAEAKPSEKGEARSSERFSVFVVNEDFQVVSQKEVSAWKKELKKEHDQALKDWRRAGEEARRAKQRHAAPPPRCVVRLARAGFKSEDEAQDWIKKVKQELERRKKVAEEAASKAGKRSGRGGIGFE